MTDFYRLQLLPDNPWHNMIVDEYSRYKADVKPRAAAVTYLMYSGMSHVAFENPYFEEKMADSYANAFQVHQKPCRTAYIHKYWIRKLTYFSYLCAVALPVDICAHTYQFVFGEHDTILEGGAFFIPYQVSHWTMLSCALVAPTVYHYTPISCWHVYFYIIRMNLIVHEYIYRLTLRKLSLPYRFFEFGLFVYTVWLGYHVLFFQPTSPENSVSTFGDVDVIK